MNKRRISIIVSTIIACALVVGTTWYVFEKRQYIPKDLSWPPAPPRTGNVLPPEPDSDHESPYNEPDQKLHIYKDITLDPDIITINYELKDVTLCGETYKTKQIFIDGVDVVQRLVQLLEDEARTHDWYCQIVKGRADPYRTTSGGMLPAGEEIHIIIDKNGEHYNFALHIGNRLPRNDGGFPIYVYRKENRIEAHMDVYLGTLR